MPGTTPAASQLDWLISSTTTIVLFCSKAIRERLRSSTWVMGVSPPVYAQRQRCQTFAAVPIASRHNSDMGVLVLILLLTVRSGKAPTVPTHTATRSILACKGYLLRCIRRCSTPFIVLAV